MPHIVSIACTVLFAFSGGCAHRPETKSPKIETKQIEEKDPFVFLFEDGLVAQVLNVYETALGASFTIDKNVPMTARITAKSTSPSKDEGFQIIEKALRDQAGVVVSPTGPKQFQVKYEPTVKKTPVTEPR